MDTRNGRSKLERKFEEKRIGGKCRICTVGVGNSGEESCRQLRIYSSLRPPRNAQTICDHAIACLCTHHLCLRSLCAFANFGCICMRVQGHDTYNDASWKLESDQLPNHQQTGVEILWLASTRVLSINHPFFRCQMQTRRHFAFSCFLRAN